MTELCFVQTLSCSSVDCKVVNSPCDDLKKANCGEEYMSREYPDYPMVGVGVVVWKDNAVLLIQRGKPPRAGTWSLPGGRQELGETTREAGVREVREETGLEVEIKDLIDVVDTIHRDDEGHVHMQYTLVDYRAEWVSGEPEAGTDAADARWVNPADLPAYNLWDETLRVIDLSAKAR